MGGGGGRGTGYIPPTTETLQRKLELADKKERERLDSDVNNFLRGLIQTYNERDVEKTKERIEKLREKLDDVVDIEQFLFGGSVAKHTYVDGLSDVDALVILERARADHGTPRDALNEFHKTLDRELPRDDVQTVIKGRLAVTITYRDGTEVQLLPALRRGQAILISDAFGRTWKETRPRQFREQITNANERCSFQLVPAIKLAKSAVSLFPENRQVTGYHMESLALEAVKGYKGTCTLKALLTHILRHASQRVLSPIEDVTGQERIVDDYMGKAKSKKRQAASIALASTYRRLDAASSVGQWKAIFQD